MLTICRFITARRIGLALLALELMLGGQARAFFMNATTSGRQASVTSITTTLPTSSSGALNGDTLVLIVTGVGTSIPALSFTNTPTGTWTQVLSSTNFNGTAANIAIWMHPNFNPAAGETAPIVQAGGNTVTLQYLVLDYFGVDSVNLKDGNPSTTTTASGSTTCGAATQCINFPSLTLNHPNDEALFITGLASTSSWTTNAYSTLTTCSKTSDQAFVANKDAGTAGISVAEINEGPCAQSGSGSTGTAWENASIVGANIGVTLLLRSAPFSAVQPALVQPLIRRMAGSYDFINAAQNRAALAPQDELWYVDGWTVDDSWANVEPNACDEYAFDYVDNQILNAEVLGKKVTLAIGAWDYTQCGGAGQPSCTGFTSGSNLPTWAITSTICDGNHAMVSGTDYITAPWTGANAPTTTPTIEMDPQSTAYQAEWDRALNDFGSRWGSIKNIVGMSTGAMTSSICCTSMSMDNGADGSLITCNGTSAQCTAICGSAGCSVTLHDKTNWLAVPPSGGGTYAAVNSSSCGGGASNQSWVQCDLVAGVAHFEGTVHAAFPNAAIYVAQNVHTSPEGLYTGSTDPSHALIAAYNVSTYPVAAESLDYSMGCHTGSCPTSTSSLISPLLPLSSQPLTGVGFQENAVESNVAGVACASGTNGWFSLSANDCVLPTAYAALAVSMYPYMEWYLADLGSTRDAPWIQLWHELAINPSR